MHLGVPSRHPGPRGAPLRFVDYDPAAAAAAAAACRAAAEDLRGRAQLLRGRAGDHLAAWEGATRLAFGTAAHDLAADLGAEAGALDATADSIDAATAHARRLEDQRRAEHEAEQARRTERQAAR